MTPPKSGDTREWLRGRASPCQGECRGFESRLPLQARRHSQVVRRGPAKPLSPSSNLGAASIFFICRSGGIGRRLGLKIQWGFIPVPVQVRPPAPHRLALKPLYMRWFKSFFDFIVCHFSSSVLRPLYGAFGLTYKEFAGMLIVLDIANFTA